MGTSENPTDKLYKTIKPFNFLYSLLAESLLHQETIIKMMEVRNFEGKYTWNFWNC